MEVKVLVEGVPRLVCGLTEETTCKDVVTVLANALGQTGRYILRERFKDFERNLAPNECVMESIKKYEEQAREVQLSLLYCGPSVNDKMSRANLGRHQPCPPLRRKEAGVRTRRGSGSLSQHRCSLPPVNSRLETSQDVKKLKRRSLTFMQEAWDWLGSLGRTKSYNTDPEKQQKNERKNRSSSESVLEFESGQGRGRTPKSDLDHQQTSCCMASQAGVEGENQFVMEEAPQNYFRSDEEHYLRDTIIDQLGRLQGLGLQIARVNKEIYQLERRQDVSSQEEAQQTMEEEMEIRFWENELLGEENFERELKRQFLELKSRVDQCKVQLEEYRQQMQNLNSSSVQETGNPQESQPHKSENIDRKLPPSETCTASPCQIRGRRPTGPTELREWWKRWSEAQSSKTETKKQVIHRTELTVYLSGTKP